MIFAVMLTKPVLILLASAISAGLFANFGPRAVTSVRNKIKLSRVGDEHSKFEHRSETPQFDKSGLIYISGYFLTSFALVKILTGKQEKDSIIITPGKDGIRKSLIDWRATVQSKIPPSLSFLLDSAIEADIQLLQPNVLISVPDGDVQASNMIGIADNNYYHVLQLAPGASNIEITKAYRSLARIHHPDKGGDAERFKIIAESYQTLSDPARRKAYDLLLHQQQRQRDDFHKFNELMSHQETVDIMERLITQGSSDQAISHAGNKDLQISLKALTALILSNSSTQERYKIMERIKLRQEPSDGKLQLTEGDKEDWKGDHHRHVEKQVANLVGRMDEYVDETQKHEMNGLLEKLTSADNESDWYRYLREMITYIKDLLSSIKENVGSKMTEFVTQLSDISSTMFSVQRSSEETHSEESVREVTEPVSAVDQQVARIKVVVQEIRDHKACRGSTKAELDGYIGMIEDDPLKMIDNVDRFISKHIDPLRAKFDKVGGRITVPISQVVKQYREECNTLKGLMNNRGMPKR